MGAKENPVFDEKEKDAIGELLPTELKKPVIERTIVEKQVIKSELSTKDKKNIENLRDGEISYLKFLEFSREERIRYCTKNNISLRSIVSGKSISFDFKFGGNKVNENIYLGTTAGQLLPNEVSEVLKDGETYVRNGLIGEFFNDSGKRLTIHQGTEIKVSKILTNKEINAVRKSDSQKVNTFLDNSIYAKEKDQGKRVLHIQIAEQAQMRGIDMDFAIKICMGQIFTKNETEAPIANVRYINAQIENTLTEFSRVRGTMSKGEHLDSAKGKIYSDSFTIKLLERWYSGEELNLQASKHGIKNETVQKIIKREGTRIHNRESMFFREGIKGLLDFIAKAEGTHDNYNTVFMYKGMKKNRPDYKSMSIRQILVEQDRHINHQHSIGRKVASSAFGRYQVMGYSLRDKIKEGVVSLDDTFNEETQDKIAIAFLNQKGLQSFLSGRMTRDRFQERIAGTWRSLPKDSSGKGVNQGDAIGNHATVSNFALDDILDNLRNS